jgi:hypothetical protein
METIGSLNTAFSSKMILSSQHKSSIPNDNHILSGSYISQFSYGSPLLDDKSKEIKKRIRKSKGENDIRCLQKFKKARKNKSLQLN